MLCLTSAGLPTDGAEGRSGVSTGGIGSLSPARRLSPDTMESAPGRSMGGILAQPCLARVRDPEELRRHRGALLHLLPLVPADLLRDLVLHLLIGRSCCPACERAHDLR